MLNATRFSALLAILTLMGGCIGSPPSDEYSVDVMNITAQPVSAGLVKSGGQKEEGWYAPSDIAIYAPELGDRHWGTLVKPGQTATIGPIDGWFESGSAPMLRVYVGNGSVNELVAVSRGAQDRVDAFVVPGRNSYVIVERDGQLTAVHADAYDATAQRPPTTRPAPRAP